MHTDIKGWKDAHLFSAQDNLSIVDSQASVFTCVLFVSASFSSFYLAVARSGGGGGLVHLGAACPPKKKKKEELSRGRKH